MNVKKTDATTASKFDIVKWSFVAILIVGGFVANYYFIQEPWPIRAVGWLVLCCVVIALGLQTATGRRLWKFFRDAYAELRRVVWPTRQQTFQVTLMVIAIIIAFSIIMWGVDAVLMWAVSWLTGRG